MEHFGNITFAEVKGKGGAIVKISTPTSHTTLKTKAKDLAYIPWGDSDNWPAQVSEKVGKNGSAGSALRLLRRAHYGGGLVMYKNLKTDTGKRAIEYIDKTEEPEIDSFLKRIKSPMFLQETIMDLEWFNLTFPEFILEQNCEKIFSVKRVRTAWCRYGKQNSKGIIDKIYVSSQFGTSQKIEVEGNEYVEEITLLNPYMTKEEIKDYCIKNKIRKFTLPFCFPMLDESFYPSADWHAILRSGWLEVANSVPIYKLGIFQNQVSIKYLIEIDSRYFEYIYNEEWAKYDLEKKLSIRAQLIQSITDELSGPGNSGKSISSIMFTDDKGAQLSAIKITAIDDKFKDGSYLPEAEAANSEVLFAFGTDPTLIGAGIPGGKLGSGSGSDKRIAFNLLQAFMKSNRDITISILEFIQDYNGWDNTLKFGFENVVIETLDKNPTSTSKGI